MNGIYDTEENRMEQISVMMGRNRPPFEDMDLGHGLMDIAS